MAEGAKRGPAIETALVSLEMSLHPYLHGFTELPVLATVAGGLLICPELSARSFGQVPTLIILRGTAVATAQRLNQTLKHFIQSQHVFFVATAAPDGRVNLSPKGLDSLRILGDTKIAWLNLTGSGNETAAHLREHPRMTMMFCAFEGEARILRVYGSAKTIHPDQPGWESLLKHFPPMAGTRQLFELDIDLIQTSCGTGVPLMQLPPKGGQPSYCPSMRTWGPKACAPIGAAKIVSAWMASQRARECQKAKPRPR